MQCHQGNNKQNQSKLLVLNSLFLFLLSIFLLFSLFLFLSLSISLPLCLSVSFSHSCVSSHHKALTCRHTPGVFQRKAGTEDETVATSKTPVGVINAFVHDPGPLR